MPDLITPKTQTTVRTITRFEINIRGIILNQSATLEVLLFDGDNFMDIKTVVLEGEAYDAWGLDDNYLITYVADWLNTNL